jgi:lipopolysaccharide transport system permease protein
MLFRQRRLLMATTVQALRAKFTGNVLGAAWLVLYPLAFLSMYSLVFIFILGVRVPGLGTLEYVLVIFSGLVPFLAFSEAFGVGTPSIIANRGLLRNTLFPIELVVARDVIVGHVSMGLGMALVWLAVAFNGHLYWSHLAVPLIYFLQILMAIGLVWISSTIAVFFRDLQQATPIIILFLMLVSPIGYTDEMVPEDLRPLLQFNPLAWFSMVMLFLGHFLVSRLKPLFSDYV